MALGAGLAIGDEAPSQPSVAATLRARYPQIGSTVLVSHLNPDVNLKKWKFILDITQFSEEQVCRHKSAESQQMAEYRNHGLTSQAEKRVIGIPFPRMNSKGLPKR